MPIIDTAGKFKFKNLIAICFFAALVCSGCAKDNAKELVQKSRSYYQQAVNEYQRLIKEGKDLDRLYLELGQLYFKHGDFELAQETLKKSLDKKAKKTLAISLFNSCSYTEALEIFNKHETDDPEYFYYQGLTCEKLNLFDEALKAYVKIKGGEFLVKAAARTSLIQKQGEPLNIKDIDPATYEILNNAPANEKYPEAGALILDCDEKIEVSKEGSETYVSRYLIKILNERGKNRYSEMHVTYDSTFDRVELEYARTIKPDGKVVEVGSRHIRDVSRYLNFPLYSNARVFIISFPEIAQGAVVDYKVKLYRNRLINKKDFFLAYSAQEVEPVLSAKLNLLLPKDNPARIKIINEKYKNSDVKLSPEVKEEPGFISYNWSFKDIPQITPEANMPPFVQINPTILISTFDDWRQIYDWWWQLAKDKILSDSSIKDKTKELISDLASEEDKARAIYNFCAKEIRYVAVEYGQAGYEPHKAEDVFKNKYGDCKDQAILLVTMLREAGLAAWPVLISTKEYYNLIEDFPNVLFNHCIAALDLEGKVIFMDPTAETCSFGDLPPADQGRKVLLYKDASYEILVTPLYPAAHNLIKQSLKIKVNNNESIQAEKNIYTFGFFGQGQRYWLLYTQPQLIREAIKEKIQEVSIGSKLEDYTIKNLQDLNSPVEFGYKFQGPEYFTNAGSLRIMPQLASVDTSIAAKDRRKYPIDFNTLDSRETIFEIETPQDFVIKYLPKNVFENNAWFDFSCEYSAKGNKVLFIQKTELKENSIPENEYPEFKKLLERTAKKIKERIILERVK